MNKYKNTYTLLIGDPKKGKTTSIKHFKKFLEKLNNIQISRPKNI